MSQHKVKLSLDRRVVITALFTSIKKLHPKYQVKNPVMFVVYIGSILTSILAIFTLAGHNMGGTTGFIIAVALWLWFTLLFANFAESIAEGRSKAQADSLRNAKKDVMAKKLKVANNRDFQLVNATTIRKNDIIFIEAGDIIPCDAEIIEGCASVDESAITGESAPVIREYGGDFSSITGGTKILSDWLIAKVAVNPGESFLDRMISMVEGAKRQKTPNEIALSILLTALTIVFLMVVVTLLPMSIYSVNANHSGTPITITALVALLVCLIPTTIGGLLSAIGVAGIGRMMEANVIATSGTAVEAAGDVDVLLLDKTGTITYGNRQASNFYPLTGVDKKELAKSCYQSSLADETPEGRSIIILAHKYDLTEIEIGDKSQMEFTEFSAQNRMSGVNFKGVEIRKGAADAIKKYVLANNGECPAEAMNIVETVSSRGSTPLMVAKNHQILGVIELKDVVKESIKEKFEELRAMGIKTVMITGDNKLTAAAIAAEAGVDDYLAETTPEAKLMKIKEYQKMGHLVAMTGDGTNDAPALAQADVAVAMNSGTQAAKEAANMVDLDSSPTKLIQIVEIGKQMLMTRGSLTTFSISNDIAKYFAIIPAVFASTYPALNALNIMHLRTPESAILSAVIFNALIIVALIPLALKGVKFRPMSANQLLSRNFLIYGVGGVILPFIGIKIIDIILAFL